MVKRGIDAIGRNAAGGEKLARIFDDPLPARERPYAYLVYAWALSPVSRTEWTRHMGRDLERAKRYRERAEGLRSIAADLPVGNAQRLIVSIAFEYERLARLLEAGDPADEPASIIAALKRPDDSK
jgi:hypothetical protein